MGPAGLTRRCQQTRPVSPLPQPQSTPSTSPSRACLFQGRLRPPLLRPATPHRLVARRSPAQHVLASTPSAAASELGHVRRDIAHSSPAQQPLPAPPCTTAPEVGHAAQVCCPQRAQLKRAATRSTCKSSPWVTTLGVTHACADATLPAWACLKPIAAILIECGLLHCGVVTDSHIPVFICPQGCQAACLAPA